MTETFVTTV